MTIWIDQDTLKRVNIYRQYKDFSKLDTPEIRARAGVIEIPEPTPPADFSDDTYYRTEQDLPPYVVYTRKSDEQITQSHNNRIQQQIASLEQQALNSGLVRTIIEDLILRYKTAAAEAGITEEMLLDKKHPAYSPAFAKVKENDNERAKLRSLKK